MMKLFYVSLLMILLLYHLPLAKCCKITFISFSLSLSLFLYLFISFLSSLSLCLHYFFVYTGDTAITDFYLWSGGSMQTAVPPEVANLGYSKVICSL